MEAEMTAQDAAQPPLQAPPTEAEGVRTQKRGRPRIVPLLVLIVIAAAGVFAWRTFFTAPPIPDSIVTLSGRIEGDDSAIAPKVNGKILDIRVREGDSVRPGDVIAILDDAQIRAQEDQARAALESAGAQAQSARDQIAVLKQQVLQNQLQTNQAVTDAEGRVRQARADLATARANLVKARAMIAVSEQNIAVAEAGVAKAKAGLALSQATYRRDTELVRQGAISEAEMDTARAARDSDEANLRSATKAVGAAREQLAAAQADATSAATAIEAARGALTTAQANLANPGIRSAQTAAVQKQIVQQESVIAGATAQVAQARAQLAEAEANRRDLVIRAPFAGTVVTRAAEPGEVVTAGTALVTLLNLDQVYLRGFVPEGEIGKVKIGQPAHVYLDSNPKQPIDAYVRRIDPQATFTPENTYFREDRVKQVVGLKVQLRGASGYAKPGMPADGEILVRGLTWPSGWKGWHSQ
jgi:membrane fusion protein YbhG